MSSDTTLRSTIQKKRLSIPPLKPEIFLPAFQYLQKLWQSRTIATYHAVKGEADPAAITNWLQEENAVVALPLVKSGNDLRFVRFFKNDTLILNRFGIPEPSSSAKYIPVNQLDLVITPLVAFDEYGNRLGMGGGFYDRTFQFLQTPADRTQPPFLVGLAFDFQKVEKLDAKKWDIRLNAVITPTQLHLFKI